MIKEKNQKNIPELLAPCGSEEALHAAITAGADAVYMGGRIHNARKYAKNFDDEQILRALTLCKECGVKSYVTLNTILSDPEFSETLSYVGYLQNAGVSALIVADLGLASAIRHYYPDLPLHASTQASGHDSHAAVLLQKLGFSRMVCAREMSLEAIRSLVETSPIEIEAFIHGALCVSHSGQCLMSSMIGGRSGNRGSCAQPCRLPYNGTYPLSLKDMCLAAHITEILDSGIASLKIEGRMKSPAYVYGVVSMYRKLLDARRNATGEELRRLNEIFSRQGSTDCYFQGNPDGNMNGIRSEEDKNKGQIFEKEIQSQLKQAKIPIQMHAELLSGKRISLTVKTKSHSITVEGSFPEQAITAPLTDETVKKSLLKLGDSRYVLKEDGYTAVVDENIMLPISHLNQLRRDALLQLDQRLFSQEIVYGKELKKGMLPEIAFSGERKEGKKVTKSAEFLESGEIPEEAFRFFDILYLPLERFVSGVNGVSLPPVILDSEKRQIEDMLEKAFLSDVKYVLTGNLGHIHFLQEYREKTKYSFEIRGSFRLNIYNISALKVYAEMGLTGAILSSEISVGAIAAARKYCEEEMNGFDCGTVVYGRVPLMTLERCVIKRSGGSCADCKKGREHFLKDRMGTVFPVRRAFQHRNVIYNSVPFYMADKANVFNGTEAHFLFTVEKKQEIIQVIRAYEKGLPPTENIRRIK